LKLIQLRHKRGYTVTSRRDVLGLLVAGSAIGLTGCGTYGGASYRFRMTVEADTPQGQLTGSSVYEVSAKKMLRLTSEERAGSGGTRGQALILDLPNGPVFVTLKMPVAGESLGTRATIAFLPEAESAGIDSYVAAVGKLGGWFAAYKAELPRKDWPLMVRFRDINDPGSVERVEPGTVGVKRVLLETTSDDLSVGIQETLPWLTRINGSLTRRLSAPDPTKPPFSAQIGGGDFSTEI